MQTLRGKGRPPERVSEKDRLLIRWTAKVVCDLAGLSVEKFSAKHAGDKRSNPRWVPRGTNSGKLTYWLAAQIFHALNEDELTGPIIRHDEAFENDDLWGSNEPTNAERLARVRYRLESQVARRLCAEKPSWIDRNLVNKRVDKNGNKDHDAKRAREDPGLHPVRIEGEPGAVKAMLASLVAASRAKQSRASEVAINAELAEQAKADAVLVADMAATIAEYGALWSDLRANARANAAIEAETETPAVEPVVTPHDEIDDRVREYERRKAHLAQARAAEAEAEYSRSDSTQAAHSLIRTDFGRPRSLAETQAVAARALATP